MNTSTRTFIHPQELWQNVGLRANQTVVHLGCGAGYYLIPAAHLVGRKGKVIGIDVRQDMLAETINRAIRDKVDKIITTIHTDLEDGPTKNLPDQVSDWTLVANILYQADPKKILTEAKRITKKGGQIIVIEWNVTASPLGPPPESRFSKIQATDLINTMKLKINSEFSPSPYHYGLLIQV